MPYPFESRQQLIQESNAQCDITTASGRGAKLQAHSITTDHYLDSQGYPVDGMMIERSTHQYLHDTARKLEGKHTLEDLSLDAFRANLYGIASSAISRGRFSQGLKDYLSAQYDRINEMQLLIDGGHGDARPMTEKEIGEVRQQYRRRYSERQAAS